MDAQRSSDGGGGREFQRISEELRNRIADGQYPLRSYLPPQRDLAEEFRVSRDTVQRVLRELAKQGWIESRQGSGSRVVKVPRTQPSSVATGRLRGGRTLGPLLEEAFDRPEVTLDVYSLTSESLAAHLKVQAERIVGGAVTPERIALRLILPSEDLAVPYPTVKGNPDDPRPRDHLRLVTQSSTESVQRLFTDLAALVPSVGLEVRRAPLTPAFKLYLLNGEQALLAPYEVIERRIPLDSGEVIPTLDVLGFGAPLTHHVKDTDPDSPDTLFVDSWQAWFDSVWNLLSE
ncbi:GntR family transcriptional regulator [Streptomyces aurantiogriseus]|uniref:GntR family transcriptional regulator n=1 Tax=Streptomyces aurantiogriseus TaxID=66870 RepID=UPI001E465572|nr:GntR family transcriptional regulator [Streptomyces aurantiogriseus]